MTPRRPWTRPAERRLLEQRAAGMRWAEIAAAHGRTVQAVMCKAWELRWRPTSQLPLERLQGARG